MHHGPKGPLLLGLKKKNESGTYKNHHQFKSQTKSNQHGSMDLGCLPSSDFNLVLKSMEE